MNCKLRQKAPEYSAFQYEPGAPLPQWVGILLDEHVYGEDSHGNSLRRLVASGREEGCPALVVYPGEWVLLGPEGLGVHSAEEVGEGYDIISCEEGML